MIPALAAAGTTLLEEAPTILQAASNLFGIHSPSDFLKQAQKLGDLIPGNPFGTDTSQDRGKVGEELQRQRELFSDITQENDARVAMTSYLQLAKSVATVV